MEAFSRSAANKGVIDAHERVDLRLVPVRREHGAFFPGQVDPRGILNRKHEPNNAAFQ